MPYLYPAASKSPRPGILFCRGGERARGNVYDYKASLETSRDSLLRVVTLSLAMATTSASVKKRTDLYPAASKSPRPGILFCRGGERARGNVYEINPNYGHNNDMIRPMPPRQNRIPGRGLFEAAGYKYGIYDSIPSGLGI
jgi:hypothetical protein